MKEVAIVAAIVIAVIGGAAALIHFTADHRPWTLVGAPGARCGYADGRGVMTCVGGGMAYTCVEKWSDRTITCGERRAP